MTDPNRHESEDLEDYETRDASETLDGDIGDDPLDTGVIPPQHWSAGMRYGTTAEEEDRGESLDQLLAEEEPDTVDDDVDEVPESSGDDENAGDEYVDGLLLDDGEDPRAGRLVAEDEGAAVDPPAVGVTVAACLEPKIADTMLPKTLMVSSYRS